MDGEVVFKVNEEVLAMGSHTCYLAPREAFLPAALSVPRLWSLN